MSEIIHIVFDIGNVLLRWDPEIPYRRLIPDAAERTRFLSEVCSPTWNAEQDRGRSWREAEDALIAEHPRHEAMIRAFRRHWPEMIPAQIDGSVAVLERLVDAGWDVTGLTNFVAGHVVKARDHGNATGVMFVYRVVEAVAGRGRRGKFSHLCALVVPQSGVWL